jgi:hypothetical protein
MEKKTKDGCLKAYFLQGFIGATVRRMNNILDERDAHIQKLEKRLADLELSIKLNNQVKN